MSNNIGISMKDNNKKTVIKSQTTNKKINPNISKECSWNHLNNNKSSFDHQDQEDYNMINAFSWPPRSYTCSFCKREFRSAQALGGHMNVHRKDRARLRQSPPPPRDLIHQYGRYGSSTYNNSTTFLNLNLNHNPNPNPNFSPSNLISPLCSMSHSKPPISSSLLPSPYSAHDNNDIESKKWPWSTSTTTIPHVEYGTSTDHHNQYHVDHQLDHHDDEYSLMINVKGRDKNMSLCGAGSGGLIHEGLAGKVYHCKGLNKKMSETTTSVRLDLEIGLDCDHNSEIGRDFLDLELRLGYSN